MPLVPRHRVLRWILILGVVAGLLMSGWSIWLLYKHNTFAARVAAIRAAGDPVSIADLAPAPLPPADDAAAHLKAIKPRLEAFAKDHGRFYKTPIGREYSTTTEQGPPTAEQIDAIRAIVAQYADVDAALSSAAASSGYASKLNFTPPHKQFLQGAIDASSDFRTAARFIGWQMEAAVAGGHYDRAIEKGINLLKLARHHDAEPTLVASLVGFAVRGVAVAHLHHALSSGEVSDEVRNRMDDELRLFETDPVFRRTLKTERALSISLLQEDFSGLPGLIIGWPPSSVYAEVLTAYDRMLPLAESTWHEVHSTPEGRQMFGQGPNAVTNLLLPSLQAWFEAANRTTAIFRSLRVYNKLSGYESQDPQSTPSIAELGLTEETGIDPFTGKPLRIVRIGDDWAVYSVGKDGKDDGGSVQDARDYGVGPKTPPPAKSVQ